ncbi:MAG: iron complex outerrane recepter protein, partial [Sphingomonadales bacterium]|nr:iron complex outerrane recepter protein [Sphingomonadales bacterium]
TVRAALLGTAAGAAFFATSANAQPNPAPKPAAIDAQTANDAQTQAQAATGSDQAIFVTARRRSEVLLNVPIAVSAYSGEQLNRQGALTITEVAKTTPNVTLKVSRGTNSTLTPFIRGIGQQDPVAGFEQGVGVYVDDVYLNRPQAAVLDIYDVDRIEVLRGPQGTLYGRNTIGGAVKFVTKRIRDDGPHVSMRTNLGTHNQADFIVTASTPITKGLLFGVAGARLSNGGYGKNLTTGLSNYNKDILAGRASLELIPSDRIFFRLTGDYIIDDSNPKGGHRFYPNLCANAAGGCGTAAGNYPVLNNVYDTRGGLTDPTQRVRAGGVALHAEADITDALKFRSITAYRKDVGYTPIDFDATPAIDVDVPAIYRNKQFSQEFQLVLDKGPLKGVAGVYYLNARAFDEFDVRLYTSLAGLTASTLGNVHTNTWAAFADFSYDFSPQWAVSLGGRFTNDKRSAYILAQTRLGGGQPGLGGVNGFGVGTVLPPTTTNFTGSRTDKAFTPRASISFKPNTNNNIYLSYSRGFKGGGFDPRGKAINAPVTAPATTPTYQQIYNFLTFKPEKVDSYELGWKAALLDHRLQLATAIFDAEYKDVQVPGSEACTVSGLPNFCGITTNAGKARMRGVEIETNARLAQDLATPGDRFSFAGSLGYLDGKYLRYITNIGGPVDVAKNRKIQNTPKWTLSGTLDYDTPAWGGHLDANTTVSYRSSTQQFEISTPFLDQPGYALWDANILWRSQGNRYELGVHAKNINNKKYIVGGYSYLLGNPTTGALTYGSNGLPIPILGKTGVATGFYGPPREVFLSAAVNF